MTLNDILRLVIEDANPTYYIVKSSTMIYLREGNNIIARGHWYQDNILRYFDHEVMCVLVNTETNTVSVKLRGVD